MISFILLLFLILFPKECVRYGFYIIHLLFSMWDVKGYVYADCIGIVNAFFWTVKRCHLLDTWLWTKSMQWNDTTLPKCIGETILQWLEVDSENFISVWVFFKSYFEMVIALWQCETEEIPFCCHFCYYGTENFDEVV